MQQPTTDPDTLFAQFTQELPKDAATRAYELKAFTRGRKVKNVTELMRLLFAYCGLDQSLRECAATFTLLYHRTLTDSSVADRLKVCLPWVQALLNDMLDTNEFRRLSDGHRLLVYDGSTVQSPGAKGTDYRIHVAMDLFRLEFVLLEVTDQHQAEDFGRIELMQGDIIMADRGLFRQANMVDAVKEGAHLLVRVHGNVVCLEDQQGVPLDLVKELSANEGKEHHSFKVQVSGHKRKEKVCGWIHAARLPDEKAAEKRRKKRKQTNKRQRTPTEESLYLCGWLLVFTTLPPELFDAKTILALYRVRWQVELAFKRFKSLLNLSQLRAKAEGSLARLWLNGKLLYALMLEKRIRRDLPDEWSHVEKTRKGSLWRLYKMHHEQVRPLISGSLFWDQEAWLMALKVLRERRRRRRLQRLPPSFVETLFLKASLLDSLLPSLALLLKEAA